MSARTLVRPRRLASTLTIGICLSVAVLIWFGYHAIQEWQRSSRLLVERRVDEAADLLVRALTRDMRAAQQSVLLSPEWDPLTQQAAYDLNHLVASAFARYPYPDAFFTARHLIAPSAVTFFSRADRPPAWAQPSPDRNQFPVTLATQPDVAEAILQHVAVDAAGRRWFSAFELHAAGTTYQVITRLVYRDPLRERIDGLFGFMVDMEWARRHYFQGLTSEIDRVVQVTPGLTLSVADERGERVTASRALGEDGPRSRREFPLMFFDPALVAVDASTNVPRRLWAVQVQAVDDPTLVSAINGSHRMLLIAAIAAAAVAIGLVLTARAVRAGAELAEMRSEFVSSVTHELKTPIATMRAVADTLALGRIKTQEGQREYALILVQEAKRLTRLIDNLLAMARVTNVDGPYSFEPLALEALVERVLGGFRHPLMMGGFDVRVDFPADLPLVRADRTAVSLVVENLVDNAIRYSGEGRRIAIAAVAEHMMVTLAVQDQGIGIPEDEIDRVTQKFFRGRHAGAAEGSGLGLAIVNRIVTAHGGQLVIRSGVGTGTTVSVALPRSNADEEANTRR